MNTDKCICPPGWVRPWWRCKIHGVKAADFNDPRFEPEPYEDDELENWARELADE